MNLRNLPPSLVRHLNPQTGTVDVIALFDDVVRQIETHQGRPINGDGAKYARTFLEAYAVHGLPDPVSAHKVMDSLVSLLAAFDVAADPEFATTQAVA
jgi:hypothetical protein